MYWRRNKKEGFQPWTPKGRFRRQPRLGNLKIEIGKLGRRCKKKDRGKLKTPGGKPPRGTRCQSRLVNFEVENVDHNVGLPVQQDNVTSYQDICAIRWRGR
jgi:hypothetical protein